MNNQWNRKRSFIPWAGGSNNQQYANLPQFSDNWSPKSWHSSPPNKRQRKPQRQQCRIPRNMNRRNTFQINTNRWEPIQDNLDHYNYRKKVDFNQTSDRETNSFVKEDQKTDSRPYLKWCRGILHEDPAIIGMRMQKMFWDKLDPKEDIRLLSKTSNKNVKLPPYDGVTPVGKEGIVTAWHCSFCNVAFMDVENKKLHLMQKNHYLRYAKFCKKYAEEKLLKLELEKKAKKERKERKGTKMKLKDTAPNEDSENNIESKVNDEEKILKNLKEKKDKLKQNQHQDKTNKLSPKVDNSLTEAISIEEDLNYDFLE